MKGIFQNMEYVFKAMRFWKNRFSEYSKQICILQASMIAVSACFAIYLLCSFIQYPRIILEPAELYGAYNQNLKDFEPEGNGIRSASSDPWIEYHSATPVKIKVIALDISGITEDGMEGEIFDTDTWNSAVYHVANGRTLVSFYDPENPEKKNLRFDLVASNSIYLEVEQIVINSRYGLFCNIVKYMLLALLYVFIYESAVFELHHFIKNNPEGFQRKRLPVLVCITAPLLMMGEILFCQLIFHSLSDSLLLWMYLLMILSMLTLIMTLKNLKNESLVSEFSCIFLSALFSVGTAEILSGAEYNFENPNALFLNILLAAFPALVFYCVTKKLKPAIAASHMLIAVLAVINHYFYQFRGNPLQLSDFLMAGTALTVLGNYRFRISQELFFCLLSESGFLCCLILTDRKKATQRNFHVSLAMSLLILLISITYSPAVGYWNMTADTQNYGYISSFLAYAKHDLIHNKPAEYSRKTVLSILETYEKDSEKQIPEEYPNLIVIMNEAFSDLPETYGFATAEDGMPFIHSLAENTVKGNILVSVFGGSTANTEYEFLTGNTMAFLSEGNVPYMQFVKGEQQSLVHELKSLGYQTVAFHPYPAGNYNRDKVYPFLGFEEFITEADELPHTEKLRAYMSDRADFLNLIDIYEKRDRERPFYMFNVTMQNHGGYSRYKSEVNITVTPESEELQSAQLLEYLSLIRETDTAFQMLTEYFEREHNRTLILMFGDHQPGLDADIYDAMLRTGESAVAETSEISYTVPFLLWANYDMSSEDAVLTSPNYLRAMLLEKAGIPLSRYDRFLSACQTEYPAINRIGCYDASLNFYPLADNPELFGLMKEYRMLQYANMFDRTVWK